MDSWACRDGRRQVSCDRLCSQIVLGSQPCLGVFISKPRLTVLVLQSAWERVQYSCTKHRQVDSKRNEGILDHRQQDSPQGVKDSSEHTQRDRKVGFCSRIVDYFPQYFVLLGCNNTQCCQRPSYAWKSSHIAPPAHPIETRNLLR